MNNFFSKQWFATFCIPLCICYLIWCISHMPFWIMHLMAFSSRVSNALDRYLCCYPNRLPFITYVSGTFKPFLVNWGSADWYTMQIVYNYYTRKCKYAVFAETYWQYVSAHTSKRGWKLLAIVCCCLLDGNNYFPQLRLNKECHISFLIKLPKFPRAGHWTSASQLSSQICRLPDKYMRQIPDDLSHLCSI